MNRPETSAYKSRGGITRIWKAMRYSAQGLGAAVRHESAFRQELLLVIVLTPLAFWLGKTPLHTGLLIGVLLFVLIVELMNSAIEALADSISLDHHPLLGRAKDLGSAAVFLALLLALLTWVLALLSAVGWA